MTLADLSRSLMSLHRQGYVPARGYTCHYHDDPFKGAFSIAVAAVRSGDQ